MNDHLDKTRHHKATAELVPAKGAIEYDPNAPPHESESLQLHLQTGSQASFEADLRVGVHSALVAVEDTKLRAPTGLAAAFSKSKVSSDSQAEDSTAQDYHSRS